MNNKVWHFVTKLVALFATTSFALLLMSGTVSAQSIHTTRSSAAALCTSGDRHYLGGDHMFRGGDFDFTGDGGNDYLCSQSHQYQLIFQTDGNLVEYDLWNNRRVVWSPNTYGVGAVRAVFQDDGNFVIYQKDNCALWGTGTNNYNGDSGNELVIDNNSQVYIYGTEGEILRTRPFTTFVNHCK